MTPVATAAPERDAPPSSGLDAADWKALLAPYTRPRIHRSLLDLATSVLPYLALTVAMYLTIHVSYWITLALAVPAAGFLVRSFIVFHDTTHGSFLPSRRANTWLGTVLGMMLFTPFTPWQHDHKVHHATAGDLDRRGVGDVETITVAEYAARSPRKRLEYRLFRNPLIMFGLGPLIGMVIRPRLVPGTARPRMKRSIIATDIALAVTITALCVLFGWQEYLLIQGPVVMLAGAAGIWLFYVQHQFEDAYWKPSEEWDYATSALYGASYLKLPRILQFFSGNIGLHHVHHLNARIPNYNLQAAHDDNPVFHQVPQLSLWDGIKTTRLKLWDEERGRLVTFGQADASRGAAA